jgi:hypothetical protein
MGLHKLFVPIVKSRMNFFSHGNSFDEEACAAVDFYTMLRIRELAI